MVKFRTLTVLNAQSVHTIVQKVQSKDDRTVLDCVKIRASTSQTSPFEKQTSTEVLCKNNRIIAPRGSHAPFSYPVDVVLVILVGRLDDQVAARLFQLALPAY